MLFGKTEKYKNRMAASLYILLLLAVSACGGGGSSDSEPAAGTKWTIMYYGDADNNLESELLSDVAEMKTGIVDGQGVNVIVLFDRISGESSDSTVFGSNFTDTRIYRITHGNTWRKSGATQFPEITESSSYEANMGDAKTLKKFIQYCKANYPADNYALILSNHGGGPKKKSASLSSSTTDSNSATTKSICWDTTSSDDFLYTAEISDTLTSSESVQLFGLDACFMSSVEFAYQFRNDTSNTGFKAEIMVASAPTETGYGWDYDAILDRLQSGGGNNGETDITLGGYEQYYDPATLTATQLGAIIIEEQRDSTASDSSQSLTCLDLSKVKAVKDAVDAMAVALTAGTSSTDKTNLEALRGNAMTAKLLHYFDETDVDEWIAYPFFDLYNLAVAIYGSSSFSTTVKDDANAIKTAVDDFVLYSFANSDFTTGAGSYYGADPFIEGKSGVHIFFPDGDYTLGSYTCWAYQWWYNAADLTAYTATKSVYGKLAWCIDNKTTTTSNVGNWFELLDSWFDVSTGTGVNLYQW